MKKLILKFSFYLILASIATQLTAKTVVSSLEELKNYLDKDDVSVSMTPGTYYFNTENCGEGNLFSDPTLLLFTGSNATFDFTGVKFEYDTDIFTSFGRVEVIEFQVVGKNSVYLNLTMEDIGNTTPTRTALCMSLDGEKNRIEGFTATTRGSSPYGYGDVFGKGRGAKVGLHKHGGCQFRGIDNHLKNCSYYLHTYGHGIFIQGATNALIEGCYLEGELRTTDEVLAEVGTGSIADELDFVTTWGYKLQPGWTFSLQEDGIRTYSKGVLYGTDRQIPTGDVTVKDCKIVKMRSGVTIGLVGTKKYVENCTALACESGFWVGANADVVNCKGDASVGPLYSEDIYRSNARIDLTLLDNYVPKYGKTPTVYFAGDGHHFTLKDGTTSFDPEVKLLFGGTRLGHRWLEGTDEKPPYRAAKNITIDNQTKYPVVLGKNSSDCNVKSLGKVTDNGSDNIIKPIRLK